MKEFFLTFPFGSFTRPLLGTLCLLLLAAVAACQPAQQTGVLPATMQGLDAPARNGARIYFTGMSERSGVHTIHMRRMKEPDIRYAALRTMSEIKGRHPDGKAIAVAMPRWQMREADLSDLFAFLKSLPK